jgi:hypothetical protein
MADDDQRKRATPSARSLPDRPASHPDQRWREPGGRPHPQPDLTDEPLVTGIVARGHSVHVPIPDQQRRVGWDKDDGREIYTQATRVALPGESVTLSESECSRLKARGFLVDPDRTILPPFNGAG